MASERAHGTLAKYTEEGCRCELCRGAVAEWTRNRTRMMAYGRWQPYVDAEPVRAHVKALMEYGIGWQRVADLAKVPRGSVSRLLYGETANGRGPSKRVRPKTAQRLLSVQAIPEHLGSTTTVDSTGTRRRLQALVAIGWSQKALAERLGLMEHTISKITTGRPTVSAGTAAAVRKLYDELWKQPPSQETPRHKMVVARALKMARTNRWVPPLAWDDDKIDDPAAVPDIGERSSRQAALAEDADELIRTQGYTPEDAAERLGVTLSYLDKARRSRRQAVDA